MIRQQPKVHLHEHERTNWSEARRRRQPVAERRPMPRGDTPASHRPRVCFVRACLAISVKYRAVVGSGEGGPPEREE